MHASNTRQWKVIHPKPIAVIYLTEVSRESGGKKTTNIVKINSDRAVVQSTITLKSHQNKLDVFRYWMLAGIQMDAEIKNIPISDMVAIASPESDNAAPSPENTKE